MKSIKDRSFDFTLILLNFSRTLPNKRVYWTIADQLIRSGSSIGANLHEAQAAISKKDFINFYHIALKSCYETIYWLDILKQSDLREYDDEQLYNLLEEAKQLGKIIGKSIITLKDRLT